MRDRLLARLVAEGVGTFLFFFVGMGSVVLNDHVPDAGPGLIGVAFAHGLVLAVLVSALGAVSGAHLNPAVTFGVWLARRIEPFTAAAYVAVQLVAAVAAGLALRAIFPESSWEPSAIATPALGEGIGPLAGITVEAVLTVVLLLAVFGTAIDRRAPRIGGMAIGLAVAADILMGGPLTGAAMNPARWFGPAVASGTFADAAVWIVGPLLGAGVAAAIYRLALEERAEPGVTPATPEG
ncbi:MAG TPA: aquaporin [Candidatus Limnocylindria bacterium]|nr:aquaporin [Candidatus Limnocylindria bacterium]